MPNHGRNYGVGILETESIADRRLLSYEMLVLNMNAIISKAHKVPIFKAEVFTHFKRKIFRLWADITLPENRPFGTSITTLQFLPKHNIGSYFSPNPWAILPPSFQYAYNYHIHP